MNRDAITGVADGPGAVGVLVTVLYIASEIREHSKSVEASTAQGLVNQELALFSLLAEHANVFRRGSNDIDERDADEAAVFEQLVAAVMASFFSAFAQYRRGLIAETTWVRYRNDWLHYHRMPGFQAARESISEHCSIEFRQALNDFEKSAPGAA